MLLEKISTGLKPPWDIHVVIEIPLGGAPVKYELDKASGAMFVDRVLHTAMHYPCHYGFVPHTLADDGDPIDALVAGHIALVPGAVLRARPVGVLLMEDEAGQDEKILCVPADRVDPSYRHIQTYTDLPEILLKQIEHFFTHYKDLESGKWVRVSRWGEQHEAAELIDKSITKYKNQ